MNDCFTVIDDDADDDGDDYDDDDEVTTKCAASSGWQACVEEALDSGVISGDARFPRGVFMSAASQRPSRVYFV